MWHCHPEGFPIEVVTYMKLYVLVNNWDLRARYGGLVIVLAESESECFKIVKDCYYDDSIEFDKRLKACISVADQYTVDEHGPSRILKAFSL